MPSNLLSKLNRAVFLAKALCGLIYQHRSVSISFLSPKHYPVVILDLEGSNLITPLLEGLEHLPLPLRGERLYFNRQIVWHTLRNLRRLRNPLAAYALAVIQSVKARLVITYIDNSGIYHALSGRCDGVNFVAIQNGIRCLRRDCASGSEIHHDHFVCFGAADEDQYRSFGAGVKRFHKFGSLRDSFYRSAHPGQPPIAWDFCLISEVEPQLERLHPALWNSVVQLSRYLASFCRSSGARVCIATRADPSREKELHAFEKGFFDAVFQGTNYELTPNESSKFISYRAVDASRLSLCVFSSLGLEAFARGRKVLFFNATGMDIYDLPRKGIWTLGDVDYQAFEQRIEHLLSMSEESWHDAQKIAANYMMAVHPNSPQTGPLRELILALASPADTAMSSSPLTVANCE